MTLMKSRRLIASPEGSGQCIVAVRMRVVKGCSMSALGQKRTWAVQKVMSAFAPKATSIAFFGMSALGQKRTHVHCRNYFYPQHHNHGSEGDGRFSGCVGLSATGLNNP